MKKQAWLVLALLSPVSAVVAETGGGAEVTSLVRLVRYKPAGSTRWQWLPRDAVVKPGDQIRTLKRSSVELTLADGSTLRLAPETDFTLGTGHDFVLLKGEVYGDYKAPGVVTGPGGETILQPQENLFIATLNPERPATNFSNPADALHPFGEPAPFFMTYPSGTFVQTIPGNLIGVGERLTADRIAADKVLEDVLPEETARELRPIFLPPDPPEGYTHAAPESSTRARSGDLAPHFDGNVFVFQSNKGVQAFGSYLRESGFYGTAQWEVAATPSTLFDGDNHVELSDLNLKLRSRNSGDLIVGRQRFLAGPVQNARLGTLIRQGGQDVKDAVTWRPKLTDSRQNLQLSYLIDAFPSTFRNAVSGTQPGWYVRAGADTEVGSFGLNVTDNHLGRQVGGTVDFSVPAVRGQLDLYGEVGRDTFGRDVRTVGAYFPGLFESHDLDLFVEWSDVGDFNQPYSSQLLVRAYYPLNKEMYGFLAAERRAGADDLFGLGIVFHLPTLK
jgi:hypothetical protein